LLQREFDDVGKILTETKLICSADSYDIAVSIIIAPSALKGIFYYIFYFLLSPFKTNITLCFL